MSLKAYLLNCTLKKSPAVSHTEALMSKVAELYQGLGVQTEMDRAADFRIAFGITSDEGEGDEWPRIHDKIVAADIFVIGMPIWYGVRSSMAQLVMERLLGTYGEQNDKGQFALYNTVAGVVVTGNEDGAHDCSSTTLFNLSHLGCVIPPNVDCYWVGDAGPGPSYIEAGGDKHQYTNKTARFLVHNTTYMAGLLKEHPIPTNLTELIDEATSVSR